MTITMKRRGPIPPESCTHKAILTGIDGLDTPLQGKHGEYLRFNFDFVRDDYANWSATAITSPILNEYSKLGELAREMIGDEAFEKLEDGTDVSELLKSMIGDSFDIVIEHRSTEHGSTFIDVVSASRIDRE